MNILAGPIPLCFVALFFVVMQVSPLSSLSFNVVSFAVEMMAAGHCRVNIAETNRNRHVQECFSEGFFGIEKEVVGAVTMWYIPFGIISLI